MSMDFGHVRYGELPHDLRKEAHDYVVLGIHPASPLLLGVLSNNLNMAYPGMDGRPDSDLMAVARWVRWECPALAQGSLAAVRKWSAARLAEG